jgi:hypothetical protein
MPAVSNLHGIGRTLACAVRVGAGAVPTDNLYIGMIAEPLGERCGIAPQQEIKRAMLLHIHEDGPVGASFAPTPVVHAEDMGRASVG